MKRLAKKTVTMKKKTVSMTPKVKMTPKAPAKSVPGRYVKASKKTTRKYA